MSTFEKLYKINLLLLAFFYGSQLVFSGQLSIYYIFIINLIFLNILYRINNKSIFPIKYSKSKIILLLFFLLLIIIGLVRGFGFNFISGNVGGGMNYIKLYSILLFYITSIKIPLSNKFKKKIIVAIILSGVLCYIIESFVYILGENFFLLNFYSLKFSIISNYMSWKSIKLFRIHAAIGVTNYILFYFLIYKPIIQSNGKITLNKNFFIFIFLYLFFLYCSATRSLLITLVFSLFIYIKFKTNFKFNINKILVFIFLSIFLLIIIILNFNNLPTSLQRTFSFLPFISSDDNSIFDAQSSNNFRAELFNIGISYIEKYFLLGKGFSFNYMQNDEYLDIFDVILNSGSFHFGLLSLLINTGLIGLILGLNFLILAIKKILNEIKKNDTHNLFLSIILLNIALTFFTFYGEVHVNFADFIFYFTFYKLFSNK